MSLTEPERHQIIQWFQEQMGPERGEFTMKAIAPVGWGDITTKHDLHELEARLELRFEVIGHRFDALEHKMQGNLDSALRTQTYAFFGGTSILLGLFTAIGQLLG